MATASNLAARRLERREIPDEVIEAARKKFLHFGVHRTTMADISGEVSMPRQTLYEYVASRDDLVEVVLVRRISEIADELKSLHTKSFAKSLVQTAVAAIRRARSDPELMNLLATAPKDIVQKVVVGHCQDIHDIVRRLLDPILDRGMAQGEVRTDKSRDEIIDWFRIVFLSLITQTGLTPEAEISIVSDFLLPSIMFSCQEDQRTARRA